MSTATLTPSVPEPVDGPAITPSTQDGRLSFPRLVRAEWIKFTSLRSTWWSLGLVAVVSVGLSFLQATAVASFAAEIGAGMGAATPEAVNNTAVMVIVFATVLTQLLAIIIGTISVTGEYSTGMIRSTLTAAPSRIGALLSKALVVGGTMFVFSLVVFAVAGLVTAPVLPAGGVDFSDLSSSLMPLLGGALFLALMAMLGVGIGFIIRNGPGALSVGIVLLFVAPVLVMFFTGFPDFEWVVELAAYLPSNAGQSLFMGSPMSGTLLETWPALITIVAWPMGALLAGSAVLMVRDA